MTTRTVNLKVSSSVPSGEVDAETDRSVALCRTPGKPLLIPVLTQLLPHHLWVVEHLFNVGPGNARSGYCITFYCPG